MSDLLDPEAGSSRDSRVLSQGQRDSRIMATSSLSDVAERGTDRMLSHRGETGERWSDWPRLQGAYRLAFGVWRVEDEDEDEQRPYQSRITNHLSLSLLTPNTPPAPAWGFDDDRIAGSDLGLRAALEVFDSAIGAFEVSFTDLTRVSSI